MIQGMLVSKCFSRTRPLEYRDPSKKWNYTCSPNQTIDVQCWVSVALIEQNQSFKKIVMQNIVAFWLSQLKLLTCNLLGLDEFIVSIIAFDPTNAALFGVDRKMNFHRSTNDGVTWKVISSQYFYNLKNETSLIMSTGIPENMVTATPSSFWSATSSSGKKWGGW